MIKNISRMKKSTKNKSKIILFIVLSPIVVILSVVLWGYVSRPVFDKFDQDRFTRLDAQMLEVFSQIKAKSIGADDWRYAAVCSANKTSWMPTGDYSCLTSISMQKEVTTVQEINELQEKYYPIIDGNDMLKQKTELDPEPSGIFGINFVVSSAEKNYTDKKSGVVCNYIIELNQSIENSSNFVYGSEIYNGLGNAIISLRCEDTARDHWYSLVKDTSDLIPEQTNN